MNVQLGGVIAANIYQNDDKPVRPPPTPVTFESQLTDAMRSTALPPRQQRPNRHLSGLDSFIRVCEMVLRD